MTLVELLACIAIVCLLAGILMPVIERAKQSAYVATDISNLHQIGIGYGLYSTDFDADVHSIPKLVSNGYVSHGIVVSPSDSYEEGMANSIARQVHNMAPYMNEEQPYRLSYPSFITCGQNEKSFSKIAEKQALGWAVSLGQVKLDNPKSPMGSFKGSYKRLLTDGAVVTRFGYTWHIKDGGEVSTLWSPYYLFADLSDKEKEEVYY